MSLQHTCMVKVKHVLIVLIAGALGLWSFAVFHIRSVGGQAIDTPAEARLRAELHASIATVARLRAAANANRLIQKAAGVANANNEAGATARLVSAINTLKSELRTARQELERDGMQIKKLTAENAKTAVAKAAAAGAATAALSPTTSNAAQPLPAVPGAGDNSGPPVSSDPALAPLFYFQRPTLGAGDLQRTFPPHKEKYITFEPDGGGFNNIRIAFEYVVLLAAVLGRTLVLPPATGWYLIDWGPMGPKKVKAGSTVREFVQTGHLSEFSDFFDVEALSKLVPVLTTAAFLERERMRLQIPAEHTATSVRGSVNGDPHPWRNWLRHNTVWANIDPRAGGHQQAVVWPTKEALKRRLANPMQAARVRALLQGRRPLSLEEIPKYRDARVIHFPIAPPYNVHFGGWVPPAAKTSGNFEWRYLNPPASGVVFGEQRMDVAAHRLLRDGVHYRRELFEAAARVVRKLALFKYAAMHVRRNELQYKEEFVGSAKLLDNAKALLVPGEVIYLATDEQDKSFFDEMQEGGHRIFFLSDFTADLADVPKSKLGIVEQIICAGGRIFFGTGHSTFSSFIYRLRGYMGAPVKGEYHLHNKYTKENVAVNDVPGAPGATFDAMDNYHEPSLLWTELN